jgi:predicted HTH domain antitoxin
MKLLEMVKENDQLNLKGLVDSGIYESEDEILHDALNLFLQKHPDYRLKLAIHRYQNDEISLGKAAEIAGVCWEDMKRILIKNGIRPKLGPETIEEAHQEYLLAKEISDSFNEKSSSKT